MNEKLHVFEKTFKEYLEQIASMNFELSEDIIGIKVKKDKITIPFFEKPYLVSDKGIIDPSGRQPLFRECVVLCKYLLLCPDAAQQEEGWVAYRDFKDAGPLTVFFANSVEKPLGAHFSGRLAELEKSSKTLEGFAPDLRLTYDLCVQFNALPRVPILLLFNDADDEFPAHCSILFKQGSDNFLDAESLAILGGILSGRLIKNKI
jgi:Domain of unknown function (DUF3786)